jgi:hypothetical protein
VEKKETWVTLHLGVGGHGKKKKTPTLTQKKKPVFAVCHAEGVSGRQK